MPPNSDPSVNLQYAVSLYMGYVRGSLVADGKVTSGGKEGMWVQGAAFMRAKVLELRGAYFPLVSGESVMYGERLTMISKHPIEAVDEHTMTWFADSSAVLKDTKLAPLTGRGFNAGTNNPKLNAVFLRNTTSEPATSEWMQQHYNFSGIQLHLLGTYPSATLDYWFNPFGGGGASPDAAVIKQ